MTMDAPGPIGKPRSVPLTILVTIVTFFIWAMVWSYLTGEDLKKYRGEGLGGILLGDLLTRLAAAEVHRAYALIALPNEPSVKLHARLGYRDVGTLDEVGHKLGTFHSVHIMERRF